jgi:glycogen phosphorylase
VTRQKFSLEINPTLPAPLARLDELAGNLRFSWHRPTRKLFESLDAQLWTSVSGNPRLFLHCVSQEVLDRAAVDPDFLAAAANVLESFDAYLRQPQRGNFPLLPSGQLVAYFCAEYGFHESFPIYSGGLGILAGDHCKTASDVGLEFVAVGLLYRQGYFTQTVDRDGNQVEHYRDLSYRNLPVTLLKDAQGQPLRISVRVAERDVYARVWRADAGRIAVVLLDTNVAENSPADREISYKLYGGDRAIRIRQEMMLGLGGVKALRAMQLAPSVWHMNEGHAAFLGLELMREQVEAGCPLEAAREAVAAASVFTTHTPVAAGHDFFPADLVLAHFPDYIRRLGLTPEEFLALGRSGRDAEFDMTHLAFTLSRHQNGVSRVHGAVSARLCAHLWKELPAEDNPIGYVTNGVHVPTFLSQRWKDVFDRFYGATWRQDLSEEPVWQRLRELPDEEFWRVRQRIKAGTLSLLRERLRHQCRRNRVSEAHFQRLTRFIDPAYPQVLTVGFARRFATYKRATLLFHDRAWLEAIVSSAEQPVVFVFAGKAHPADEPGKQLLREVTELAASPEFLGRVLFLEDYDMGLARSLVAGVDVWLNNPVAPLEASGTSGIKAAINGTINLSVLDGWWAEAYDGENGWAIPSSTADAGKRDAEDARSLYEILQDEVAPLYYERDAAGVPARWIHKAKRSMATILPCFNTRRMLANYVTGLYAPAALQGARLAADGAAAARGLAAWKRRIAAAWPGVRLRPVGERPERAPFGQGVRLRVAAELNGMAPEHLRVELLLTRELPQGHSETPPYTSFANGKGRLRVRDGHETSVDVFRPTGETTADGVIYAIECTPPWAGQLAAEVRAVPFHPDLSHPYELGLMHFMQME